VGAPDEEMVEEGRRRWLRVLSSWAAGGELLGVGNYHTPDYGSLTVVEHIVKV